MRLSTFDGGQYLLVVASGRLVGIMSFSIFEWLIMLLCGFIAGVSKTGIPGAGILVVPLMAMIIPAKESVGLVLPILIFADIFAAAYYRRHAQWGHLIKLIPCAFVGIVIGYFFIKHVESEELKPLIGFIVAVMLVVQAFYERHKSRRESANIEPIRPSKRLALIFGLIAGITTMMANAAGPVMVLYLLTSGLPKREFVGTGAWYFFILNWVKVPFAVSLGIITVESLKINLFITPAIAVGALLGILVLKKMSQKFFREIARVLAALSALRLLFG